MTRERDVTKLRIEEDVISGHGGQTVETLLCRPHGAPPWPGVVIVHGHQLGERSGGRATAASSVFQRWHQRGFLAAAVSQPGYGRSTGPADYAGPATQAAVRVALRHVIANGVDPLQLVLHGLSRGAIAAGLAATSAPHPTTLVLQGGTCDLPEEVLWLEAHLRSEPDAPTTQIRRTILELITAQCGREPAALAARSLIAVADRIVSDVLLLEGAEDDRVVPGTAARFAARLSALGRRSEARLIAGAGHMIPSKLAFPQIDRFLNGEAAFAPSS